MTTGAPDDLAPATLVVAGGRPERRPGAGVNVPVELSSTFAAAPGRTGYGRNGNPVWEAFEEVVGRLEGGRALVFGSGMAAVSAALALAPAGPVVAPTVCYNMTSALLDDARDAGREVRRVDQRDLAAVAAALAGAALLWLESPTNPLMEVADLGALVALGRDRGVLVCVDNTFATPLLQQPLSLGADVVVHSVTKYLAGHSDVVLGVTVTREDDRHDALARHRIRHGAIAGPQEVWLALRGLRTLALRLERSCANAAELARRLAGHPGVQRVRYPGFGAMLAIEVPGGAPAADAVTAACRLWLDATSLGGVESLIERRRKYAAESPLVPESLLRLSVGIEDVEDLWRDLDRALRAAPAGGPGR